MLRLICEYSPQSERSLRKNRIVSVDEMQIGSMTERGKINEAFIFSQMQKSIMLKKKSCMFYVELGKALDRAPRKVLGWAMRKKETPEDLVRSVMSLYEGTKSRVDSELSEEFEVKVGMCQGSVLSPFLFSNGGRCCHRICQIGCAK